MITIHQPSTAIYNHFDRIVVLAHSRTMCTGTPQEIIKFLDDMGLALPAHTNPAEHLLDLATGKHATAITEKFRLEHNSWCDPATHEHQIVCKPVTQTHCGRQFWVLLQRNLINQWRDPGVFWVRWVMYVALCLIVASVYWNLETDLDVNVHTRFGLHAYMSSFLLALTIATMPRYIPPSPPASFVRYSLLQERAMYLQETNSGHYKALPYVLVLSIANIPYLVFLTLSCTGIQYTLIDLYLDGPNLYTYAATLGLSLYSAEALMRFLSAMIRGGLINSLIIGGGAVAVGVLLSGFFIPYSQMPVAWQWIGGVVLHRYPFRIIIFNDFHRRNFRISGCVPSTSGGSNTTNHLECYIAGQTFLHAFDVEDTDIFLGLVIIFAMGCCWNLLLYIALALRCKRGCAVF